MRFVVRLALAVVGAVLATPRRLPRPAHGPPLDHDPAAPPAPDALDVPGTRPADRAPSDRI